jgi:hypothetical protein
MGEGCDTALTRWFSSVIGSSVDGGRSRHPAPHSSMERGGSAGSVVVAGPVFEVGGVPLGPLVPLGSLQSGWGGGWFPPPPARSAVELEALVGAQVVVVANARDPTIPGRCDAHSEQMEKHGTCWANEGGGKRRVDE